MLFARPPQKKRLRRLLVPCDLQSSDFGDLSARRYAFSAGFVGTQ